MEILPDLYSSLSSDARYILTSNVAVRASTKAKFEYRTFVYLTTTAASSSVTSLSSSTTDGTVRSGSTAIASKTPMTSTSTGSAPVAAGGFVMGIVDTAGILGLTPSCSMSGSIV